MVIALRRNASFDLLGSAATFCLLRGLVFGLVTFTFGFFSIFGFGSCGPLPTPHSWAYWKSVVLCGAFSQSTMRARFSVCSSRR